MAQKIVAIQPCVFSFEGTYVKGPYGKVRAWLVANWETWWVNPHAQSTVLPADCLILAGKKVLWDGRKEMRSPVSVGVYR